MIELWALAGALAAGIDWRRLAALGLAVLAPLPATVLVACAVWKGRRASVSRAALFCEAAAAELRAGAALRRALQISARSVGCSSEAVLAEDGAPLELVARALGAAMPDIRAELELVIAPAQRSGARIADLLDEIGSVAIARAEVAAEVQMSTAPVRATVLVFALAPLAYLATRGGLPIADGPGQSLATMAGTGLFLAGLAAVATMMWRAT
jgi:hypothetical protein